MDSLSTLNFVTGSAVYQAAPISRPSVALNINGEQPQRSTGLVTSGAALAIAGTASVLRSGRPSRRLRRRAAETAKETDAEQSMRTGEKALQYTPGDKLAAARNFAQTRFFAVAPWSKDVESRPIFAVSDGAADAGVLLARRAFLQFGKGSKCQVSAFANVSTPDAMKDVIAQATEQKGALLILVFISQELGATFTKMAEDGNVPCVNAFESVVQAMEMSFKQSRKGGKPSKAKKSDDDDDLASDSLWEVESKEKTIYAVSDETGQLPASIARAALKLFPDCGVKMITVCPKVSTLEEVDYIANEAFASDSMILFSFANPGMGRFMRQQCERIKVFYADVFQPVVIAMEKYLNYPPVGVAGGMDLEPLDPKTLHWEKQPL